MFEVKKTYKVEGFSKNCPSAFMHNLLSMGFIPGSTFEVKKIAPLMDPCQIEIKGFFVSLRKSELNLMEVKEL
ncbi:MAG TPA: FeoA domain-containing protein [Victivallales bacterium]|nr:FeoA domain-containing protein [Victivallales bacterium]